MNYGYAVVEVERKVQKVISLIINDYFIALAVEFFLEKLFDISYWNLVYVERNPKYSFKKIYNPFWDSWAIMWIFFLILKIEIEEIFVYENIIFLIFEENKMSI